MVIDGIQLGKKRQMQTTTKHENMLSKSELKCTYLSIYMLTNIKENIVR